MSDSLFNPDSLINENDFSLNVVKTHFLGHEQLFWEDLFTGYNELRVVTYSYGIRQVTNVIKYFDYAEIIVGNENLIGATFAELFARQEFDLTKIILPQVNLCKHISENQYLVSRVQDSTLKLYTPQDLISHQKIYLLKSYDGKVRTISGSANFSFSAWNNVKQLENISYCDDIECYEYYLDKYETLKEMSKSEISIKAITAKSDDEMLEEIPFSKELETKDAIVINTDNSATNQNIFLPPENSVDLLNSLKAVKIKPDKNGKIVITSKEKIKLFSELTKNTEATKEKRKNFPQLLLDYEKKSISYNGNEFDLNPEMDEVKSDILLLLQYMNLFEDCIECDIPEELSQLKMAYWKLLNYMFLSPFLSYFREYIKKENFDETAFPIYYILSGESCVGKTSFIQTVQKMMLDRMPTKFRAKDIKVENLNGLKENKTGYPVLIDEMENERWKFIKNSVKDDDYLSEQNILNYPCFIFTSNHITFLEEDIKRRVLFQRIDVKLDEMKAKSKKRQIGKIQKDFSNSLYRKYANLMFSEVETLIKQIPEKDITEDWIPDIYKSSSETIQNIFNECGIEIPNELQIFDLNSYIGNSEKLANCKNIFTEIFNADPRIFTLNKKKNKLEIDFTNYQNDKRNKRLIDILLRDLPGKFKAERLGLKLFIDSTEFKNLTGIKIRHGFF